MEAAKENATPAKEYDLESDLAKKIKKQVEFYFSDSNFPKDKFLRAESEKHAEGYIPIALLSSFNRMKSLTQDVDFIAAILKNSESVTVDATGKLIKRTAEIPSEDTTIRRTIYAKEFPQGTTIETVEAFFAPHGRVQSVRLRKKADKAFKGSVFVELATEEEVQAVLEAKLTLEGNPLTVLTKQEFFKEKRESRKQRNEERKRKANEVEEGEAGKEKEAEAKEEQKEETGVVIRFEGVGPESNRWDIQPVFEAFGTVKFVEYKVGEGKGYVRMSSAEEAKAAVAGLTESKKTLGSATPITVTVIEGEEEKGYWQKIWEGKTSGRGRRGRGGRGRGGGRGGRGGRGRGRGNKRQKRD